MIEIRHLKYFVVVARELHFTTAAKLLHIAQPALSQNIRQIEEELGVQLLERDSHRVTLTDAGVVFHRDAMLILESVSKACMSAKRTAQGVSGQFRLGCTTSTLFSGLAPVIRKFRRSHLDIHLELYERTDDDLVKMLKAGELDMICTDNEVTNSSFDSFALSVSRACVALYKTHPLAKRRSLRLRDLSDEKWIWPDLERQHNYSEIGMRRCQLAGFEPTIAYFVSSPVGGFGMVGCDLGIMLCIAVPMLCPMENVVIRPLSDQRLGYEMQLHWRSADVNVAGQRFIETARELQKKKSRK